MDPKSRYVAIVKHQFGHFFTDKGQLIGPHLHVYQVDPHHLMLMEGYQATSYDHYFWKNYNSKSDQEKYEKLI
jgi:hypothetical protein